MHAQRALWNSSSTALKSPTISMSQVSEGILPPTAANRLQGWRQTLDQNFNGNRLSSCWKTSYVGNVHTLAANGEKEWYVTPADKTEFTPFSLSHGILSIKAVPSLLEPKTNAHGHSYLSGMIMSDGCFDQTYGYFEIKAKVPKGKGIWPAFWLLPASHKWPPEIDVFEMFGAKNSRNEGGEGWVHTGTVHGGTSAFNSWHKVEIDQYTAFHTYGLLWGPQNMAIYVDGKLIAVQPTPKDFHQAMYLIANLAIGGNWAESPDAATHFPAVMTIDYIRAWQYVPWRSHPVISAQQNDDRKTSRLPMSRKHARSNQRLQ